MAWALVKENPKALPDSLSLLVLLRLCDRARSNGRAWPSQTGIASDLQMSRRAVQNKLDALEEAGLIRRDVNQTGRGTNVYWITLPAVTIRSDDDEEEPAHEMRPPAQEMRSTGARDAHEPTKEPTKEPPPEDAREARSKPARASRLSEDWKPSADDRGYARNLRFSDARIDGIAENFRDYWVAKAGEAARKTNWELTWRSWIRREAERIPRARRGSGPSRGPQIEGGLF